jgi:hypothetical protein
MARLILGHYTSGPAAPRKSFRWAGLFRQLHFALTITDRLQRWSAWRAKSPNIPHRWLAEETAVFAIELAGAFVSDLKSRTCGVQTINEHASPRRLQPKLLLILKRTHSGQRPEMVHGVCDIFWLAEPPDRMLGEEVFQPLLRIERPRGADGVHPRILDGGRTDAVEADATRRVIEGHAVIVNGSRQHRWCAVRESRYRVRRTYLPPLGQRIP